MRFAHLADIHLGFQKTGPLQDLEGRIFRDAVDECISRNVDFVLVCGDLFHVNIPEMRVQKMAMQKFRDLHDAGIPVYTVYGSHDFSPVSNSAIDLLESAGYLEKVTRASHDADNLLHLDFLVDEKTGAKLAGLSGLKAGRDAEHYRILDRAPLESEPGFKVFLFHGAISEMMGDIRDDNSMPASYMPAGFDYYAGGHLHTFRHDALPGYANVVYPGTLFAGYHSDMEVSARGERRGFAVVDFDDHGVTRVDQVVVPGCGYHLAEIDAEGKSAESVNSDLTRIAGEIDPSGRVVILKISGELSSGRTADIDVLGMRRVMGSRGALETLIDRNGLTSKEYRIRGESAGTRDEIEARTFEGNIGQVRTKRPNLAGAAGVRLAGSLLSVLRQPRPENEKARDYDHRVNSEAVARMGLDG